MFVHVLPNTLPASDLNPRMGRLWRSTCRLASEIACAVTGHDYHFRAAGNRMFLRCDDCGHETPGWHLDVRSGGSRTPRWRVTRSPTDAPKVRRSERDESEETDEDSALHEPLAELERRLLSAYVAREGHELRELLVRTDDDARRLLAEASRDTSGKLSEIEARSHYLHELHGYA